jgi:Flp pilus assembly protein TadG
MRLFQRFRRFGSAKQGVAAIEFAIIAPMMIFLLLGAVDLIDVLNANKRVHNAASSLSDVVARDTEVSDDEIAGIWSALDLLMFPSSAANMQVRVTSVRVVNATTAEVVWSEGRNMGARSAGSAVSLPAAMMIAGTSIIMTEAETDYSAPLGVLTAMPVKLDHTAYRRSRLVDPIPRV